MLYLSFKALKRISIWLLGCCNVLITSATTLLQTVTLFSLTTSYFGRVARNGCARLQGLSQVHTPGQTHDRRAEAPWWCIPSTVELLSTEAPWWRVQLRSNFYIYVNADSGDAGLGVSTHHPPLSRLQKTHSPLPNRLPRVVSTSREIGRGS